MKLANGQGWCITATRGVRSWVKRLASLMELKTCQGSGCPRLIFIKQESDKKWSKALLKEGWKSQNLKVLQFWFHSETPDVLCDIGPGEGTALDIIRMWQALYPIYRRAQDLRGIPLHAALVKRKKKGVLLAAPGNTGKTTCCSRLPHAWQVLCDDETLIVRNSHRQYLAPPIPTWSNYLKRNYEQTLDVQQYVPLSSIFFLEQAKIDDVIPMGQGKAAVLINQSAMQLCYRNWRNLDLEEKRELKKKLFDNACELSKTVPAFMLRVSLYGRFWEEIEKVLKYASQ